MQTKTARSPWFLMTKALLGTSTPLRAASASGETTGWHHFGVEIAQQIRRYLAEFYEVPPADTIQSDELAPLVAEFQRLAHVEYAGALAWVEQHLPTVLDGADDKQLKDFAAGLRAGAVK
ncbi:MAG: hypothetical protein SGJ19_21020 [Planctomycetia bacterium]|nr:hypothetical protein [Planctomycetia bacterium]